jgi:transcription-repair coupling factor (superfamily II helicase)
MTLSGLTALIARDAAVERAVRGMADRRSGTLVAPAGVRPAVVALAAAEVGPSSTIVVVTATGRDAEAAANALSGWTRGVAVFPSWETLPHERLSPQADTMARRVPCCAASPTPTRTTRAPVPSGSW